MYKKVVVPLDGSKLAELALPHLEEIAKGCSIPQILLISVTQKVVSKVSEEVVSEDYVPPTPDTNPR
jgi:nucleotide-binding universal stress UspA family protein